MKQEERERAQRLNDAEQLLRQWLSRLHGGDFLIPNQGGERDRCCAIVDRTRDFLGLKPSDDPAAAGSSEVRT